MGKGKIVTGQAPIMSATTRTIRNPYREVAEFRGGVFHFNFKDCLGWMEKQGKDLFGAKFHLYRQDLPVIYKLMVYAIGDAKSCAGQGLDLKKGLLVNGPVGCGKTSLVTLVNFFFPKQKQYRIKSAREVGFELEQEGYKVIGRYGKGSFTVFGDRTVPVTWCFDDLGVEQPVKYYGNDCQVMAEIFLSRYDLFVSKGMLTHLTTNLSASELEARYGNRVRSRMREMFNLVAFDKGSQDKRK